MEIFITSESPILVVKWLNKGNFHAWVHRFRKLESFQDANKVVLRSFALEDQLDWKILWDERVLNCTLFTLHILINIHFLAYYIECNIKSHSSHVQ